MRALALGLVLIAASPTVARSQEVTPGGGETYVAVKLGAVVPKHDDMEGFDNGFALEGVVGYRANENLAIEASVGRFAISGSESGVLDGLYVTVTEDVVAYPVLGTVKALLPVDKLEAYALFGGGFYFMSAEATLSSPGYLPLTESDSDTPFGFHLGGGFNVRLSPRALLGAEVKYIIGTTDMWDDKSHFDSVMVGGALSFSL